MNEDNNNNRNYMIIMAKMNENDLSDDISFGNDANDKFPNHRHHDSNNHNYDMVIIFK